MNTDNARQIVLNAGDGFPELKLVIIAIMLGAILAYIILKKSTNDEP